MDDGFTHTNQNQNYTVIQQELLPMLMQCPEEKHPAKRSEKKKGNARGMYSA